MAWNRALDSLKVYKFGSGCAFFIISFYAWQQYKRPFRVWISHRTVFCIIPCSSSIWAYTCTGVEKLNWAASLLVYLRFFDLSLTFGRSHLYSLILVCVPHHRWLVASIQKKASSQSWAIGPSLEEAIKGTGRRAQVSPTCSMFEQREPWTEPQLNLRSSWPCCALILNNFSLWISQRETKRRTGQVVILLPILGIAITMCNCVHSHAYSYTVNCSHQGPQPSSRPISWHAQKVVLWRDLTKVIYILN